MQGKAAAFVLLLLVPAFSGCASLFERPPSHWDVQVKLTTIVTSKAPPGAEDVGLAVELATRAFNATGAGVTYRVINDAAPDGITKAIERLAKGRPTAFIAALGPDEAAPALRAATAAKIPLLLLTPANGTLTGPQTAWLLPAGADPALAGRALADLAGAQGPRRVALIAETDAYTARAATAFRQDLVGTLVLDATLTDATRAGELARQACEARADKLVFLTQPTVGAAIVRGIEEAGCRATIDLLAAPWTRENELAQTPGKRPDGRHVAEGVRGVYPARSEAGVYRGTFEAVYGRAPGRLAAAAHDAVAYATLAAFAAKGAPGAKPFQGPVLATDVKLELLDVASSPGAKMQDFATAAAAVQRGDDIDWVGFAHDFELSDERAPIAPTYDVWTITAQGGFQTDGDTVRLG